MSWSPTYNIYKSIFYSNTGYQVNKETSCSSYLPLFQYNTVLWLQGNYDHVVSKKENVSRLVSSLVPVFVSI